MDSIPNRRHVLTGGLPLALSACGGFGALDAAVAAPVFPRSFAGSRTVSSFASGLFFREDAMPISLNRAAVRAINVALKLESGENPWRDLVLNTRA
jgi:hypothetical protein